MKIQKMSSLVCGFFCIQIPCANIVLISRPSGSSQKMKDEVGKKYLTSNFMVKSLQFFNGGCSILQARSRYFIARDLTSVCTHKQDGVANPDIVYIKTHRTALPILE